MAKFVIIKTNEWRTSMVKNDDIDSTSTPNRRYRMKKGFTLAEVLVTLGIIGVVAALTIPSLNANVSAQKIGPSLAKAVNTLENANRTALVKNEATSLGSIGGSYLEIINPYINGTYLGSQNIEFKDYDGYVSTQPVNVLVTKDGIGYYHKVHSYEDTINLREAYANKYVGTCVWLAIDINGPTAGPNTHGKDIFEFLVDYSGAVIPYGGVEYMNYSANVNEIYWQAGDANRDKCNDNGVGSGQTCGAAIIDNGWKVNYK